MGLSSRNVFLAGASGLVGGLLLRRLLADSRHVGKVFAPSRRKLGLRNKRLISPATDFSSPKSAADLAHAIRQQPKFRIDAFVSCLGTTLKAAGSREAFIAVDRDLVLRLAQLAFELGARHAILVSSVGASRQSGNFYLRVKGEVEDALVKMGFARVDILRPGLLLGKRQHRRPAEALAQLLAPLANPALFGKFRRYRSIDADAVAAAIAHLLQARQPPGQFIHLHDAIRRLSAASDELS